MNILKQTLYIIVFLVLASTLGCSDDENTRNTEDSDSGVDTSNENRPAPEIPDELDSAKAAQLKKTWHIIGNQLTQGDDALSVSVTLETDATVEAWIDGQFQDEFEGSSFEMDIEEMPAGEHELLLARKGDDNAFAQLSFYRSHPIYVLMTNDWDDSDNTDAQLTLQEQLHESHPRIKMTHFVGPYTFTDPAVSEQRVDLHVEWLLGMRDQYGDEIGLHIHPYCNFVETTSIPCRTAPTFGLYGIDESGYTVILSSYTQSEMEILLDRANELFEQNGLGTPTAFRAGGWTAEINTLMALENKGYVADSSANNWSRLEEWKDYGDSDLYGWNEEHWASIDEYSQPYYPSVNNILKSEEPSVDILEVPDNGILVDYVTGQEMIDIFNLNWPGGVLDKPTSYVIGYHPSNFKAEYLNRLDEALNHIDSYLASDDNGPVIYETLSNMSLVWPPK
jgi:hypothetical protein